MREEGREGERKREGEKERKRERDRETIFSIFIVSQSHPKPFF